MESFKKILPYLIILGMAIFIFFQRSENEEYKALEIEWTKKEQNYIDTQKELEFFNKAKEDMILGLQDDRIKLDTELDSIKNLRKNEKPLPTYTPVGDDKLLDSILHYARK